MNSQGLDETALNAVNRGFSFLMNIYQNETGGWNLRRRVARPFHYGEIAGAGRPNALPVKMSYAKQEIIHTQRSTHCFPCRFSDRLQARFISPVRRGDCSFFYGEHTFLSNSAITDAPIIMICSKDLIALLDQSSSRQTSMHERWLRWLFEEIRRCIHRRLGLGPSRLHRFFSCL